MIFSVRSKAIFNKVQNIIAQIPLPNKQNDNKFIGYLYYPWGADNQFPYYIDQMLKPSDSMESALQTLTELSYGMGVQVYRKKVDNGKLVKEPIVNGPAVEFLEKNNITEEYLEKAFYNFHRYGNAFPQFRLDKNKITGLFCSDSPWCRLEKVNPRNSLIEHVFISDQWNTTEFRNAKGVIDKKYEEYFTKLKLINRYTWENDIKRLMKSDNFVMWHIADYTPGERYYGCAPWFPILDNGILETDALTGLKLKAYYDKAMNITYHFEVSSEYLLQLCDGDTSPENQRKIRDKIQETLDTQLSGAENSYTSILTTMIRDPRTQEMMSNLRIKVLDNPITNSSIIKDTQLVASRIKNATRLDDALVNAKTTGSLEADSGSEKKSAMDTTNLRMTLLRNKILFPLYMIKHINGWDADIEFGIITKQLETLDKNPTGSATKL